jgi:hypothetical protein
MSSPHNNNKKTWDVMFGRAAPGTANGRDAARAEDMRVLTRAAAFLSFCAALFVFNASTLWPYLFGQ